MQLEFLNWYSIVEYSLISSITCKRIKPQILFCIINTVSVCVFRLSWNSVRISGVILSCGPALAFPFLFAKATTNFCGNHLEPWYNSVCVGLVKKHKRIQANPKYRDIIKICVTKIKKWQIRSVRYFTPTYSRHQNVILGQVFFQHYLKHHLSV